MLSLLLFIYFLLLRLGATLRRWVHWVQNRNRVELGNFIIISSFLWCSHSSWTAARAHFFLFHHDSDFSFALLDVWIVWDLVHHDILNATISKWFTLRLNTNCRPILNNFVKIVFAHVVCYLKFKIIIVLEIFDFYIIISTLFSINIHLFRPV